MVDGLSYLIGVRRITNNIGTVDVNVELKKLFGEDNLEIIHQFLVGVTIKNL